MGANTTLRIPGGQFILRLASQVNGLLINDSGEPSLGSSLTIQGNVSGDGKIRNLGQMTISSARLDVELETDGNVEINGLVTLTKPSENQGSDSLDAGDNLHYQGSGHNLATSLGWASHWHFRAAVSSRQALTATVQIDAAASADVTSTVDVQGNLAVIILGAPSDSSASRPQTSSGDDTVI